MFLLQFNASCFIRHTLLRSASIEDSLLRHIVVDDLLSTECSQGVAVERVSRTSSDQAYKHEKAQQQVHHNMLLSPHVVVIVEMKQ